MKKENVKKFWNKHKNTIKKTVILVTVPVAAIVVFVAINKILDKYDTEIFRELEDNMKSEA